MMHRTSQRKHRDVTQSSVAVATHTADANIVVARLEVYNSIFLGITDATAPLFREEAVLDLVEEPPIVSCVVQLRRDRGGLDGAWSPLLSAPRDLRADIDR